MSIENLEQAKAYTQIFDGFQPWKSWATKSLFFLDQVDFSSFGLDINFDADEYIRLTMPTIAGVMRTDRRLYSPDSILRVEKGWIGLREPDKWYANLEAAEAALLENKPGKYTRSADFYLKASQELTKILPDMSSKEQTKKLVTVIKHRFIGDHLPEIVQSFEEISSEKVMADIGEFDTRIYFYGFDGALSKYNQLNSVDYMQQEAAELDTVKQEYVAEAKKLEEQLEQLRRAQDARVAEIEKSRLEAEEALRDKLRWPLTLIRPDEGNWPRFHRDQRTYEGDLHFGFSLNEALVFANYVKDKNLHLEIFLDLIEATRKSLEYHWPEGRRETDKNIFNREKFFVAIPGLAEVTKEVVPAIDLLFKAFMTNSEKNVKETLPEVLPFIKASKEALDQSQSIYLHPAMRRTIEGYLDFLVSEQVTVFLRPTFQKLRYEQHSFKEK